MKSVSWGYLITCSFSSYSLWNTSGQYSKMVSLFTTSTSTLSRHMIVAVRLASSEMSAISWRKENLKTCFICRPEIVDGIHRSQILGTLFCMRSIFEISWPQTETEGQYTVCTWEKIQQSDSINCMGPDPQGGPSRITSKSIRRSQGHFEIRSL